MWGLNAMIIVTVRILSKSALSDASNEVTTRSYISEASSKDYSGATSKDYSGATNKDYSGATSMDYSGATSKDYLGASSKDFSEATTTYLDYSDLAIYDAFNGSFLTRNNYRGLYSNASYFPGSDNH
jgi:hypothetical protein